MLPLLFTAQKGKEGDAKAKIAAAFTLTVIIYSVVVIITLLLCACVFGLDGAECRGSDGSRITVGTSDSVGSDGRRTWVFLRFLYADLSGYAQFGMGNDSTGQNSPNDIGRGGTVGSLRER